MVNDNVTQPPQNSQDSKSVVKKPGKSVSNGVAPVSSVSVNGSVSQYAKLIPNLQLTKRFLDRLHYDRVTIQVLPAKTGKFPRFKGQILLNGNKGSSATSFFGSLSVEHQLPLVNDLIKLQQEQMGVFIMVNEGDGKVHPGKDTCRSSASVQELKACFVDTDAGNKDVLLDFCCGVGLSPHLIVESSPGKFHIYFLLQTTYKVDRDVMRKWSAIQKKFMSLDPGFDQSMGDVGKLLRLPGFYHNKTDKPFLVEIYSEDHHGRYSLDDLHSRVCGEKPVNTVAGLDNVPIIPSECTYVSFEPYSLPTELITEGGRHQAIASYLSYLTNFTSTEVEIWENLSEFCVKYIDEPERFLTGDRLNETARLVQYYIDARNVEQAERAADIVKGVDELPVSPATLVSVGGSGDIDSLEPEEVDNLGLPKINYVDHPEEVGSRFVGKRLRKHGFIPQRLIYTNGCYFVRHNDYWKEIPNDERNHLGQLIREFVEKNKYNYLETAASKKRRLECEKAGEPLPPKKLYCEKNFRPRDIDAVRTCAKESCVYDGVANKWFVSSRSEKQPDVIAVRNGLLDVRSGELMPHTHEFFNTGILPCNYASGVVSPLWERALVDWFGTGKEGDSARRELQLWFGYLLLSSVQLKNIACFQGPRNCGKSTVVKVASILLGSDYTLNRRQQDLSGDFGFAGLDKCKLLFFEEFHLEHISPTQSQALKTLTSLNAIQINQKFKPAYTAENMSRIMIATNSEPGSFKDPQGALADRFLFWVFQPPQHIDKLFLSKLTKELSGVLNWAVEGAQKLIANNGEISQPIGIHEEMKKSFIEAGKDPIEKFVQECCRYSSTTGFISYREIGEIFDRYIMTQSLTKEEIGRLSFSRLDVKKRFHHFLLKNCRFVKDSRTVSERGFEMLKVISELDSVEQIVE